MSYRKAVGKAVFLEHCITLWVSSLLCIVSIDGLDSQFSRLVYREARCLKEQGKKNGI